MAAPPPIPVTIVTGFLGSGKTTLILNLVPQLRAKSPDYRLALLKNEFGDVAASAAVSGVRELLNGCICCNLVGQLGPALRELADTVAPDRVVVETSGSAFPATLALEVNRVARETGRFLLDSVVSVVDVENWKGYDDTSYTAKVQARYTDLVVFKKWELAGEDRYEECLDRVGDLDVDVAKVKSDRGFVSMDLVFGVDGALAKNLTDDCVEKGAPAHAHAHQQEVEVLSLELRGEGDAAVSLAKLLALLEAAPKDEVYRIKAVMTLSDPPPSSDPDAPRPAPHTERRRYILNWAFSRWTFTRLAADAPEGEHASSADAALRMTMILARCEANKWKKKIDGGGLVELDAAAAGTGQLTVTRVL